MPDHHQYRWIAFSVDTLKFLIAAFDFYIGLLEKERQQFDADPVLNRFLSEETRREFRVGRDLDQAKREKEWLQEKIEQSKDPYEVDIAPVHGTIRYYKSVALLYLGVMKIRRNELASEPNISKNLLAAIDRDITKWEERFAKNGVFAKASPLPLLAEQQFSLVNNKEVVVPDARSIVNAARPAPVAVGSIQILDEELRKRCLDIFDQFQKNRQPDRNDTVVSEATRILENRLRKVLRCDTGIAGRDLASAAFAGDQPKLQISSNKSEQQAVLQLFLGTFGFIRNPVQHRLIESLPAERVLQILGWIDYLLTIINQSEQRVDEDLDRPEASES